MSTCVPGVPNTSQLPRLTNAQYEATVNQLFEITSTPSTVLAPDSFGSLDERTWQGYKDAAEAVATQVMGDAAAKARTLGCTAQDAACAQQFIENFGAKVFRRPLVEAEVARFMKLFTDGAAITETGSFDEVTKLIVKSFLISPSFITRAEIAQKADGTRFALSSYEVASRLSYMLWDSMPDDELFAAATADSLGTAAGILTQAQRMLQSPKARAKVARFHEQYMHMGTGSRWADVKRDTARYPQFTAAQVPLFTASTDKFFDNVVFDKKGSFQDLLTLPSAYVNADLAPLYGLAAASFGADLVLTDVDPALRAGVLTQVGFLAVNAAFGRTSPILRGAFIQKEVLCQELGSPPADAQSTMVPTTAPTNRENTDNMTAGATCVGCHHGYINPTGFPLEAFDAIGVAQTVEKGTGAAIDTTSSVPVGDDVPAVDVAGPKDMMVALADSRAAQSCYAKKWVQFAYERTMNSNDACVVDDMTSKLTSGGYTVIDLITDLTQSDSFRYRAQEVAQ